MIRQLPIFSTIIVIAAALTMVGLGIWQLGRADEKAALISQYSDATAAADLADFPMAGEGDDLWFRRSTLTCQSSGPIEPVAGTAATGVKGWTMRTSCITPGGKSALVDLGFSRALDLPQWNGGAVTGVIAPGPRLVADPPLAGLQPLAKPDPSDLPNNHLAYAGQWFFFALTALVIYGFAVRGRLRKLPK